MKHYKKLAIFLAGTQLLMALSACSSNNNTASSNTGDSTVSQSTSVEVSEKTEFDLKNMTDPVLETAGLSASTVVATSNGREITAGALLALTVSELDYLDQMAMYGMGDIPWGEEIDGETFEATTLKNALELALIYQLIFEVAEEEGISLDEDFSTNIQEYLDSVRTEIGGNETIYQYVLWQALITEEEFVRNSQANELFNLIYDKYFGEGGSRVPSDEEILETMVEQGYYSVKHILLSTVDSTTGEAFDDEAKAEVLARAEGILADLQASDDLENYFHEQMLELSEDPGSISMPEGYNAYPGQMVPEFEEASLLLEENTMSGLVESSFGYHIIYRQPLAADVEAISELINELSMEMQESWLADNPIETNDLYDQIDLQLFYNNLNTLRYQVQPYVEAGDPDLVIEDVPEAETEETDDAEVTVETEESDETVEAEETDEAEETEEEAEEE